MGSNKVVGVTLFSLLVLAFSPKESACVKRLALVDFGVYTFQNVGDYVNHMASTFLTAVNGNNYLVTDLWRDIPSQKWKVTKGYLYTSYMLKPTSEATNKKVAVSAVKEHGISYAKKEPYVFGMASSLYWSVVPAERESGFYMIQNLHNDECLESSGPGKAVIVTPCRNAKTQQWSVHPR